MHDEKEREKTRERKTRPDTRPLPVADGWAGAFSHFSTRLPRIHGRTDKASYIVVCPQLKRLFQSFTSTASVWLWPCNWHNWSEKVKWRFPPFPFLSPPSLFLPSISCLTQSCPQSLQILQSKKLVRNCALLSWPSWWTRCLPSSTSEMKLSWIWQTVGSTYFRQTSPTLSTRKTVLKEWGKRSKKTESMYVHLVSNENWKRGPNGKNTNPSICIFGWLKWL